MGRLAVAAMLLALAAPLVLLPPYAIATSTGVRRPKPKINGYAARARPQAKKAVSDYLKDQAKQGATDYVQQRAAGGHQLGSAAASAAGAVLLALSVGGQNISVVMDVSSQLIWAQCQPCTACLSPPSTPSFQPNDSASFSAYTCGSPTCQTMLGLSACPDDGDVCTYTATYGDDSNTTGVLSDDTFTFGTATVAGMVFGCSVASSNVDLSGASGVVGFGRGALSLVSQLALSRFSYFIAPDDSDGSDTVIQLGGDDAVQLTNNGSRSRSRSTPLLASPLNPEAYYVNLVGIEVDGQALGGVSPATLKLRADGSGGVALSTTVPLTYLETAAYKALRQAIVGKITPQPVDGAAFGLDLCYKSQSMADATVPRLTLVFDGDDAKMELTAANYFFKDNATGLECLTIMPVEGWSILGSLMQTGTTMIYDIDGGMLTFETTAAASAASHLSLSITMIGAPLLFLWVLLLS